MTNSALILTGAPPLALSCTITTASLLLPVRAPETLNTVLWILVQINFHRTDTGAPQVTKARLILKRLILNDAFGSETVRSPLWRIATVAFFDIGEKSHAPSLTTPR